MPAPSPVIIYYTKVQRKWGNSHGKLKAMKYGITHKLVNSATIKIFHLKCCQTQRYCCRAIIYALYCMYISTGIIVSLCARVN